MGDLSAKQIQILEFLKEQIHENGYPPTMREICDAVGLSSPSTVHSHLARLEEKGYIRRNGSKSRAIEVLDNEDDFGPSPREMVDVPIVGTVTAGEPILAVENIEDTFPIPVEYVPNANVFMLKVKGDSMINAGIFSGDLILVQQQSSARNGDIVVALLEDYVTVKRFYKEKDHVRLQPENDAMSPILVRDVRILGKVFGLFRRF